MKSVILCCVKRCHLSVMFYLPPVVEWSRGSLKGRDLDNPRCFRKEKKNKQTIQAAQSKLYLIVFFPPPKDWCHPNVCTVSPVKARPWTALACFSSSQWLPLSLRCEGCKLWPTVRQAVTFTDQNNLTSHSRAWGSLFFFLLLLLFFSFFFIRSGAKHSSMLSLSEG